MKLPKPLTIIVITGGAGRTGEQVVNAALAQFEQPQATVVTHARIVTKSDVKRLVRQAKRAGSVIVGTLVEPQLRQTLAHEAGVLSVPLFDVLGPLIRMLSDRLEMEPRNEPGLSYELNKEQFDRIDAVDFTLRHDDGQRIEDLPNADIVLVGASRVSKSVTCFFLAYRGLRAANVPLSIDFDPPHELLSTVPKKVIALTMNAQRLQKIRDIRGQPWQGTMDYYADRQKVTRELAFVEALAERYGWRCLDVSYKAVEEVAEEILQSLKPSTHQ